MWKEAGRQGFLGLEVPGEFGGSAAGDYRFNTVLIEELAKVNAASVSSLSIHFDVVLPYLADLAGEAQKKHWLPRLCSGDFRAAIAMTEPGGGSDLAALRTSARRTARGWILNGAKTFITNGVSADLVLLAARTGGKGNRGISLFLVPGDQPGLTRSRPLDKLGQHEADTAEIFLDDVELGDDALLGEAGKGFKYLMERLPQERIGAAVSNLAHAKQLLQETLGYVTERQAFGRPIGSFQHNKFVLAELVTKADVTQAYLDACVAAHAEGRLGAADAAKAKWWSSDLQNEILDRCLQLHGGYGYLREYRIARAWADARVTKIWAGSNEIMKEIIGRGLGL